VQHCRNSVTFTCVPAPRRFISDHGGHTNAFTAAEDTNYQFDVNWDALPEALDRFVWLLALTSGCGNRRGAVVLRCGSGSRGSRSGCWLGCSTSGTGGLVSLVNAVRPVAVAVVGG
jgi:hypothetical protein